MGISDKAVEVAIGQIKGYLYPSKEEQSGAFALLVELSTRTTSAPLADTDGLIRDVLSSLYAMFEITRNVLREQGPPTAKGSAGNLSLAVISVRVLNEVFRPVLSRWHPALKTYEQQWELSKKEISPVEWERQWPGAAACRADLVAVRRSVRAYLDTLGRISGASALAASVTTPTTSKVIDPRRAAATQIAGEPRRHMVRWLDVAEGGRVWVGGRRAKPGLKAFTRTLDVAGKEKIKEKVGPPITFAYASLLPDAEPPESVPLPDGSDFWFDFAADMGDGFDGTAPIAWLIGRERLHLPPDLTQEYPTPPAFLPRASLLVFGGDEVYPTASKERYREQLALPYRLGWEDAEASPVKPTVLALPGNHDWLGGIGPFNDVFADGKRFADHWVVRQQHSWWHVSLPQGWWIWGVDTGLSETVPDQVAAYFEGAAEAVKEGDSVILCTPKPLWQMRQTEPAKYAQLRGVIDPIIASRKATLRITLSGDSHYFAHFERADGHSDDCITAGGAGAFLHPTHNIPERIPQESAAAEFTLTARWPLASDSRSMAPPPVPLRDRQTWLIATVGALLHLLFWRLLGVGADTPWRGSPQDGWRDSLRWATGSWAAVAMLVFVVAAGGLMLKAGSVESGLRSAARNVGLLAATVVAATFVGGAASRRLLFPDAGLLLGLVCCLLFGLVTAVAFFIILNWANGRMRVADNLAYSHGHSTRFKHFLRFRIDQRGDLTCFAIGIDPVGKGWYRALTTEGLVPPSDPAGVPRLHYVWGKTYPRFVPKPLKVSISVSDPTEGADLESVFKTLCANLLRGGHWLYYGGLPGVGYTEQLFQIEQEAHHGTTSKDPHVVNYLANYLSDPPNPEHHYRMVRVPRAVDHSETEAERIIRDLTLMRERMTADQDIRVVIGGALRPGDIGTRLAPGVLEEAYLAVRAGKPLLVAGGFGGAGKLIADALLGSADPVEIDALAKHFTAPVGSASFRTMLDAFKSTTQLRNGLAHGENVELLVTRDHATVEQLIARSLERISP